MNKSELIELSVIVPVYNEEDIMRDMIREFSMHLDRVVGIDNWQYIIVDNGSTDATPTIIREIEKKWPLTKSIWFKKPDYGNAMKEGLKATDAKYAKIINIEQWDTTFLSWAWEIRERYDIFIGSKRADPTLNHQTPLRHFLSWGLNSILS